MIAGECGLAVEDRLGLAIWPSWPPSASETRCPGFVAALSPATHLRLRHRERFYTESNGRGRRPVQPRGIVDRRSLPNTFPFFLLVALNAAVLSEPWRLTVEAQPASAFSTRVRYSPWGSRSPASHRQSVDRATLSLRAMALIVIARSSR